MIKKARDYQHEYEIRRPRIKRLAADIDRDKADAFKALLARRGVTYIEWLLQQIDRELEG